MSAPVVLITSHRGGAMKTSLTLALAMTLAKDGSNVVIVDPSIAGGASSIGAPQQPAGTRETDQGIRHHESLPITFLSRPGSLGSLEQIEDLLDGANRERADVILVDSHSLNRSEVELITRFATLVIAAAPAGVIPFRSLPPFLEMLRELRAQPGRSFSVLGVMTGVGATRGTDADLERHTQRQLAPIVSSGVFPHDESWRVAISKGEIPPPPPPKSFMDSNLRLIAKDVTGAIEKVSL